MIDELNIIYTDKNRIRQQLRAYFEEMPMITDEQVEERTEFAENMYALMMLFFAMVDTTEELGEFQDIDYYISMVTRRYEDVVDEAFGKIEQALPYIAYISQVIVNNTFNDTNYPSPTDPDRAFDIAVNEANTIVGFSEYEQAIASGKTQKQWLIEKDNKVRKTHQRVDEKVIPITEYFEVGDSLMLYPHDSINGDAREVVNCRCHVKYLNG